MEVLERVLMHGDLKELTPDERTFYYKAVCESIGVNPLTRPFEYITLNGKLTLYARKDCTDQLRNIHGVSLSIVAREVVDDIYVVTSRATKPDGRCDEALGAVPVGALKGEAKANAFMKCETKSKRRVTLSICGLGILDESEIDSIPGAIHGSREAQQKVAETKNAQLQILQAQADQKEISDPAYRESLVPQLEASIAHVERTKGTPLPSESVPVDQPIDGAPSKYNQAALNAHWQQMLDFTSILAKFAWAKEKLFDLKGHLGQTEYYRILAEFGMKHANDFKTNANARLCFEELWRLIWDWEQEIPAAPIVDVSPVAPAVPPTKAFDLKKAHALIREFEDVIGHDIFVRILNNESFETLDLVKTKADCTRIFRLMDMQASVLRDDKAKI